MLMSRRASRPAVPVAKAKYMVGTLIAASMAISCANAATLGHSRIVSALGQPLHLEIPVLQLTPQEVGSLRATPAPAAAWREAGMTPPVALESMRLVLLDGYRPDVKVIQVRSNQTFDQPIVDILLDVRSASGEQRYQVSLLAHADSSAIQRAGGENARNPRPIDGRAVAAAPGSHATAGVRIPVRNGDNMFAVAERNAVQGVTVYQMMIALQRANNRAFIEDNVNLVKAGATLTMPDMDVLTALSDREARRIFQQHAQAFARYRQRSGGADVAAVATSGPAMAQGSVSESVESPSNVPAPSAATADRLRLSGGAAPSGAGTAADTQEGDKGISRNPESRFGMLAASGAIASDAAHGRPSSSSPGSTTGETQGASQNGSSAASSSMGSPTGSSRDGAVSPADPDDQAALEKGVAESRARVVELEDNVRHLNEALQQQGIVAAEAALEGARSVSEAIKEAIGLADDSTAAADGAPDGAGSDAPAAQAGKEMSGETGQGQSAASTSQSRAPGATGTAPSMSRSGDGTAGGRSAGNTDGRSGAGSVQSDGNPQQGAANTSSKEGKEVSWFQENILAVIGGGLLLLILVVAWILRRISNANRDPFESDSPITDSMLREKLRDIDLDLDETSPSTAGRPTR